MASKAAIVPVERIEKGIFFIRGEKVMLDSDLAELYEVETKVLIQAVKRNIFRFPVDFMFQLTDEEFSDLKSQIVTSSWGGRRYAPYAFTEQGVAIDAIRALMKVEEKPKRKIGFSVERER